METKENQAEVCERNQIQICGQVHSDEKAQCFEMSLLTKKQFLHSSFLVNFPQTEKQREHRFQDRKSTHSKID